jgi:hypothetical protein
LGGLFAVLFSRLLGPGTAGMGMRRRFLAVSLSLLAIGGYTLPRAILFFWFLGMWMLRRNNEYHDFGFMGATSSPSINVPSS